jgi:hypothetical protein
MSFLSKLITLPIRAVNVVIKTGLAVVDASMAEPVKFKQNALDDIADNIEEEIDRNK